LSLLSLLAGVEAAGSAASADMWMMHSLCKSVVAFGWLALCNVCLDFF